MNEHFPALIVAIPLISSFFIITAGWVNKKLSFPLALAALFISLYSSIGMLFQVLRVKSISYQLGGWESPFGIEYAVDHLNAFVAVIISVVAFINLFSAKRQVEEEFPEKANAFYSLYTLFVAGLLGITVTGDAFNLYVLLEITALSGYAMIGMGRDHAPLASLHYVFMGTIGASFYLLGIGYLYLKTGSLNMADLYNLIPQVGDSTAILLAFVFCLVGLFIKMAFFPLHNWLPNAYSYSPAATSGLIAPLTTKVMIYVMMRLVLSVFPPSFSFSSTAIGSSLVWLATIAIFIASILALAQKNLFKMLSYIIIAEVGYMVGGFWLGNNDGITGAILHIANDAVMTLCLFLAASNILYTLKRDNLSDLKGIIRKMPFSMTGFLIGAFAIIGVPPTCGFFSKWYLIKGGLLAGHHEFATALIFSSLINVILFFRIIEIGYFEPLPTTDTHGHYKANKEPIAEAPIVMIIPLMVTAVLLIAMGLYTDNIVTHIIRFALPK